MNVATTQDSVAIIMEVLVNRLPEACKTQILTSVRDALVHARRHDLETEVLLIMIRELKRDNSDLVESELFDQIDMLRSVARRELRKDLERVVENALPKADGSTQFNIVNDLCAVLRL